MLHISTIFYYFVILGLVKFISTKFKLYDFPNRRKIHHQKIFNTGGLVIYLYYLLIINLYEFNFNIELIISIGLFICLIGFIDDRINLSPSIKIITLIIPSAYLMFSGILLEDLGKYEYIGALNLGKFQIPFLILAIGLLTNATNYIDGIDGLLLTFYISCLGYYIFLLNNIDTIYLLMYLIIPAIFNLILNLLPSKSGFKFFSGNIGSLFIGFFISFITIELYIGFSIHPAYLIWPLWYPVYDFLFVSLNRSFNKKSILKADNSHFHHRVFLKLKKSHIKTIILFLFTNGIIISFGYLISNYSKLLSLMFFIIGSILYLIFRFKSKKWL